MTTENIDIETARCVSRNIMIDTISYTQLDMRRIITELLKATETLNTIGNSEEKHITSSIIARLLDFNTEAMKFENDMNIMREELEMIRA